MRVGLKEEYMLKKSEFIHLATSVGYPNEGTGYWTYESATRKGLTKKSLEEWERSDLYKLVRFKGTRTGNAVSERQAVDVALWTQEYIEKAWEEYQVDFTK